MVKKFKTARAVIKRVRKFITRDQQTQASISQYTQTPKAQESQYTQTPKPTKPSTSGQGSKRSKCPKPSTSSQGTESSVTSFGSLGSETLPIRDLVSQQDEIPPDYESVIKLDKMIALQRLQRNEELRASCRLAVIQMRNERIRIELENERSRNANERHLRTTRRTKERLDSNRLSAPNMGDTNHGWHNEFIFNDLPSRVQRNPRNHRPKKRVTFML